jgi:hypothetical protein
MQITPDEWVELEAAANNDGRAYTSFDPNDRSTPIIKRLVKLGLMELGARRSVCVLTPEGRRLLASGQPS